MLCLEECTLFQLFVLYCTENEIKAGLVENLCKVNKNEAGYPIHRYCEMIALM
jgi:hypothetical protein